jgi:hypothetical protein
MHLAKSDPPFCVRIRIIDGNVHWHIHDCDSPTVKLLRTQDIVGDDFPILKPGYRYIMCIYIYTFTQSGIEPRSMALGLGEVAATLPA